MSFLSSSCSSAAAAVSISPLPSPWGNSGMIGDGLISEDLRGRFLAMLDKAENEKHHAKKLRQLHQEEHPAESLAEDEVGRHEEDKEKREEIILPTSNNASRGNLERVQIDDPSSSAKRFVERLNFSDIDLAEELGRALRPALPHQLSVDSVSGRCTKINNQSYTHEEVSNNSTIQPNDAVEKGTAAPSPQQFSSQEYDHHMGPFAGGEWELAGVDHHLQLFRYPVGGIFTKHRDGPRYYNEDLRTFFTVLVYLADDAAYEGGRTTVFTDDEKQELALEPKTGRAFVMLQRTLHQGSEVTAGIKDCLRCDILYRRRSSKSMVMNAETEEDDEGQEEGEGEGSHSPVTIGPTASESILHLSDKKLKALHWRELGLQLESSGELDEAVQAYQKATKLIPTIMDD